MTIALLLLLAAMAEPDALHPDPAPPAERDADGYALAWSDEFNIDGPPDPADWRHERGFVRNEELQWYQEGNAFCENGVLVIEARRERIENPGYREGSGRWQRARPFAEYTSASINTRGNHRWLYGRFVIRARVKAEPGLWPAIWTLGEARGWPAGGEIDIMEYYDGVILANAAWQGRRATAWDDSRKPVADFNDPDWDKKFHVWRMDWDHDFIRIYCDDELLNEIDLSQTFNAGRDGEVGANPLREPHYLLLNLAIGGTRGGDPSGTDFPSRYEVDYVRVYQKPGPPAEEDEGQHG